MSAEQKMALLRFLGGVILFFGVFFVLRFFGRRTKARSGTHVDKERWLGFEALEVVEILKESPTIKSFMLRRQDGRLFPRFRAGQFVSVAIAGDTKMVRSYSIMGSPLQRGFIKIAVKKIEGGRGSTWMHELQRGDRVLCTAPSGGFVDSGEGAEERVYVAGGIGVTPILAMLQTHVEARVSFPLTFFYGARSGAELAFHEQILAWQRFHPGLQYHHRLSHESSTSQPQGNINFEYIQQKLGAGLLGKRYYICGPEVMTAPLIEALLKVGVPEENIHTEKFVSPTQFDVSQLPERHVQVRLNGRSYSYNGHENILSFLEAQGVAQPYACRSGVCGSCKCRLRSGKVLSLTDSGLSRQEKKEGLILTCVSYPESDIELQ